MYGFVNERLKILFLNVEWVLIWGDKFIFGGYLLI